MKRRAGDEEISREKPRERQPRFATTRQSPLDVRPKNLLG
jgi:hypothetical protein